MRHATLGPFPNISRLTLGGAGLGQVWGETSPEEAIATLHEAVASGINLIDTAPMYLGCEVVIARAFGGKLPKGVRITTKCRIGDPSPGTSASRLQASLEASLKAMQLEHADVFFLHNNVCETDSTFSFRQQHRAELATTWPR
jgi:aryl-alcohol dehydrogenase-like predicted oxidoreductase